MSSYYIIPKTAISGLWLIFHNSFSLLWFCSGSCYVHLKITYHSKTMPVCFLALIRSRRLFGCQVVVGGRNKYLINGCNANNSRVQDLFRSVQLNVNNPHFLIMQGRITKVLNMKPAEVQILRSLINVKFCNCSCCVLIRCRYVLGPVYMPS